MTLRSARVLLEHLRAHCRVNGGLGEVAGEPVQHSPPRIGRRRRVVARAGVVEKRMVGIGFDHHLVDQPGPAQGRFGRRLRPGDAGVQGAVDAPCSRRNRGCRGTARRTGPPLTPPARRRPAVATPDRRRNRSRPRRPSPPERATSIARQRNSDRGRTVPARSQPTPRWPAPGRRTLRCHRARTTDRRPSPSTRPRPVGPRPTAPSRSDPCSRGSPARRPWSWPFATTPLAVGRWALAS